MQSSGFVIFAGTLFTFAVGCSGADQPAGVETSSDALVALSSAEIVGDLRYGQTSAPVSYTDTPRYRAFRFQGGAGDAVDAWVRSPNGDARAWLLDAAFKNVVSNDNASTSTRDSHLVTTLAKSGVYYVAFREVTMEDASFTVSLNAAGGGAPCDPEEENCGVTPPTDGLTFTGPSDPLNPASCAGAPWTLGAVESRLPSGLLTAVLPASTTSRRVTRSCSLRSTGIPSCSAWSETPMTGSFSEQALQLVDLPSTHSATASLATRNTGKYARRAYSCVNETGDLCPVGLSFPTVTFGITAGTTVSASGASAPSVRGYAGGEDRDPMALLLGGSLWGHKESDNTFWWGGIDVYPTQSNEAAQVKALIDAHVPSASSGAQLDATVFTSSCARLQFRSTPPAAGVATWTESIAAVLAKY